MAKYQVINGFLVFFINIAAVTITVVTQDCDLCFLFYNHLYGNILAIDVIRLKAELCLLVQYGFIVIQFLLFLLLKIIS